MFEFLKKKKLKIPDKTNNGGNEDAEDVNAPDADTAVNDIDAALRMAEHAKKEEEREKYLRQQREEEEEWRRNIGSCSC